MKSLPESTVNFTIPSQEDGVILECRIYHPNSMLSTSGVSQTEIWKRKGAIVAHPYPSLGGNMDDPVVGLIVATCLSEGFIVGTFNFRGAGNSEGYTSWQSNSEQNDYRSFIGFMVYYLYQLNLRLPSIEWNEALHTHYKCNESNQIYLPPQVSTVHLSSKNEHEYRSTGIKEVESNLSSRIQLLLAGYSYGSVITMSLPAELQVILAPFETARADSNYAKIRQRAEYLVGQQSSQLYEKFSSLSHFCEQDCTSYDSSKENPTNCLALKPSKNQIRRIESLEISHKPSHHPICPSFNDNKNCAQEENSDMVESIYSLNSSIRHLSPSPKSYNLSVNNVTKLKKYWQPRKAVGDYFDIAYLLVSPLQGLVFDLLTLWSYKFWRRESLTEIKAKLTTHPTLAIYGDRDVFVSANKLRDWAENLAAKIEEENSRSRFTYIEVKGADHFWHDHKNARTLQAEIKKFVKELC